MKFHFVPAASSTAVVSMPRRSKMIASSFIKLMLRSRCVFSITLAASATRTPFASKMPAVITDAYTAEIRASDSASQPLTILRIVATVRSRSPGLIRSGEYPNLKSSTRLSPLSASTIGRHTSSVHPG